MLLLASFQQFVDSRCLNLCPKLINRIIDGEAVISLGTVESSAQPDPAWLGAWGGDGGGEKGRRRSGTGEVGGEMSNGDRGGERGEKNELGSQEDLAEAIVEAAALVGEEALSLKSGNLHL